MEKNKTKILSGFIIHEDGVERSGKRLMEKGKELLGIKQQFFFFLKESTQDDHLRVSVSAVAACQDQPREVLACLASLFWLKGLPVRVSVMLPPTFQMSWYMLPSSSSSSVLRLNFSPANTLTCFSFGDILCKYKRISCDESCLNNSYNLEEFLLPALPANCLK